MVYYDLLITVVIGVEMEFVSTCEKNDSSSLQKEETESEKDGPKKRNNALWRKLGSLKKGSFMKID